MYGITELIGSKLSRVEGVGLSSLKFSSGRLVVHNPITLSGCDGMKSLVFRVGYGYRNWSGKNVCGDN